jgi:thioredoxin reductase (NADPH)
VRQEITGVAVVSGRVSGRKSESGHDDDIGDCCGVRATSVDVAIIGAGAAGLCAAGRCEAIGLSYLLFDALPFVGGQCASFYPDKELYGVPGVLNVRAKEFIDSLEKQCLSDKGFFISSEKILEIKREENEFLLNGRFSARCVVVATGIGSMEHRIPVSIEGVDRADGFVQHVCVSAIPYAGKEVIIVGGGDSALDFAFEISRFAKKVTIIHKRGTLSAEHSKISRAQSTENIRIILSLDVLSVANGNSVVTNGGEFRCDHVVFCCGFKASPCTILGFNELGVCFDKNDLIEVSVYTMGTVVLGIYAIGDVATYCNKKKNLVSCFYEADTAIRAIYSSLR